MVSTPVGFVGAGQMGEPMIERLLAAGVPLTVHARRPEVAARLEAAGATMVGSLGEVAHRAEVMIVCVFDDDQLRDVTDGLLAAMAPGAVLVSHTTGTLATIERLSAVAADRSVQVVDGPVSGTVDAIRAGTLTVLLGGDPEAVERGRSVVGAYGDPVVATGRLGSALKIKLVNNILFAANLQLAADAVRLGRDLGVEPEALMHAVMACSGASTALGHMRAIGSVEAVAEAAGPFLRKDVDACNRVAQELGITLGLLGDTTGHGPLDLGDPS